MFSGSGLRLGSPATRLLMTRGPGLRADRADRRPGWNGAEVSRSQTVDLSTHLPNDLPTYRPTNRPTN